VKFRADGVNNNKRAEPNVRYEWKVRCECGHDGFGIESPWSAVKIFNTPDFDPSTGIYTPPPGVSSNDEYKLISSSDIVLVPNPANTNIRIQNADGLPDSFDWMILDMTGRLIDNGVVRKNKSNFLELDVNDLAQGSYQILMVGTQFSASAPFMIKR
ncbi:MAG: T9SS type A sorting domain-containing protein, partial [Flavobacteriales bacterium]|nr:T9SS type A sorting domain-containing protein [Flavobacteriales bacterium]